MLGSPTAPVTIVEYADLTRAACVAAHREIVRRLVDRFVRSGVASLELRLLAPSARSRSLARSAYAASAQRRGWEFVQLAALRSAPTSTGVSPQEPDARLAAALGLREAAWRRSRSAARWTAELQAAENVAAVARFGSLPVFLVRGRDAQDEAFVVVAQPRRFGELVDAIARARR